MTDIHDDPLLNEAEDTTNPKDKYGAQKVDLGYLPMAGMVYGALGMMNGGVKYGPYNWREKDVKASIYISAAIRHMKKWGAGEENDPDSGIPHIGHAIACCMILADAITNDALVDDRAISEADLALLDEWNDRLKDIIPEWEAAAAAMKS